MKDGQNLKKNKVKLTNNTKQMKLTIKELIILIIIFISTSTMVYISYKLGYSNRANDINIRITQFPNNQEECFTREEVDSFIYGK